MSRSVGVGGAIDVGEAGSGDTVVTLRPRAWAPRRPRPLPDVDEVAAFVRASGAVSIGMTAAYFGLKRAAARLVLEQAVAAGALHRRGYNGNWWSTTPVSRRGSGLGEGERRRVGRTPPGNDAAGIAPSDALASAAEV